MQPLIEVLGEMLNVHRSLVELCAGKNRAIMENNTAAISDATRLENRLMHESKALDGRRGKIVAQLAEQLEVPPDSLTLTALAEQAAEDMREQLIHVQKELVATLGAQKELNAKSRVLLETHMEYAEMVLNLMVGDEDPINNFYDAKGKGPKGRRQTAGLMDTQV